MQKLPLAHRFDLSLGDGRRQVPEEDGGRPVQRTRLLLVLPVLGGGGGSSGSGWGRGGLGAVGRLDLHVLVAVLMSLG